MSIKWMSIVWKLDGLYQSEKFVLLALADNANNDGQCWPSIPDIAERCVVSTRQAIRIISQLVERGYLAREMRSGKSTLYTLQTPDTHVSTTPDTNVTPDKLSPLTNATNTPDTHVSTTPDKCDIAYKEEPSFEPSLEEPSKGESTKKEKFSLPENLIPFQQDWDDFMELRKRLGAQNTTRAKNAIVSDLQKFWAQGFSPHDLIETAIKNSWKSVYLPKEKQNGKQGFSTIGKSELARIATDKALAEMAENDWLRPASG